MKVTFLGTGAAEGVPAMFCSCEFCSGLRKKSPAFYRSRTQVMIDDKLCIDFPPEAYTNSVRFGVDLSALGTLLITHSHMDHFYAHDFILRGYKYAQLSQNVLQIFGNAEVKRVFEECTRRELKSDVAPHLKMTVVKPYEFLTVENYRVLTIPAIHKTEEDALLYYVEKQGSGYLHLYDTGAVSGEAIDFLVKNGAKAAAVALDCTFLDAPHKDGARHMCITDCAKIIKTLKAKGVADDSTKFIITHFSHHFAPSEEKLQKIEKEYSVIAAYDGLTVEI